MYKADVTYMNNPYMFVAQASRRHSAPSRALRLEAHVRCPFTAGWNLVLVRELFINFTFKLISKISRFFWFGLGVLVFFLFFRKKTLSRYRCKIQFQAKTHQSEPSLSCRAANSWKLKLSLGQEKRQVQVPIMPASNWGLSPDTARLLLWLPHTLIFLLYKNLVCLSFILLWNKRKCCNILKPCSMAEQVSHQSFLVHRSFEMRWLHVEIYRTQGSQGKVTQY